MKAVLLALAVLSSASAFAAPLSQDQIRTRVASIAEVKAVYNVYKGNGWACTNTQVQMSADGGSFEATKACENSKPGHEASANLTIRGFVYGEGSSSVFVVDSINWNRAG